MSNKVTINELKMTISEIIEEAKKKAKKAEQNMRYGKHIVAYGTYDEALDFSAPLGAYNYYRQQGQVNWGPFTGGGTQIDSSFEHPSRLHEDVPGTHELKESELKALRSVVREVIENGLIPEGSAWREVIPAKAPRPTNSWELAEQMSKKEEK
jgi:hypothetical protein